MFRILSLPMLLLCNEILQAQKIENTFYAGAAMSKIKAVDKIDGEAAKFTFTPGLSFGYSVALPVGKTFQLQPGLNFVQKGGKSEQNDSLYGSLNTTIILNYFEIPLNFVYRPNKKLQGFFIGGGPAVSAGLGGKAKETAHFGNGQSSTTLTAISFGGSEDDEFRLFEFSLNGVAGYSFNNGLTVAFNYDKGFSNLLQGSITNEGELTTSYFALRLGYAFYAVRKK